MEAIGDFFGNVFDSIFNFFTIIVDCFTILIDFITNIFEWIGMVINLPSQALDVISNLSHYWPPYLWLPLLSILTLVVVFRVLKIVMSGG